jgi:hypothetical protein
MKENRDQLLRKLKRMGDNKYQKKYSIKQGEEEKTLAVLVRDGHLKPEQVYVLCPELKMMTCHVPDPVVTVLGRWNFANCVIFIYCVAL